MNKLMTVVAASVCAVSLSGSAVADAEVSADKKVTSEEAESLEEEEPTMFEAGVDLEFYSAYVWRSAVQTDRPVIEPCIWGDFTYFEPFWFGFSIWQNWDLTDRRRECLKHGLTETDYNVHIGATAWRSDDESMSLDVEIGHEWYDNHGAQSDSRGGYADTRELYAKVTFNNEIVNVYGQVSWMYDNFGDYKRGFYYELGLNREFDVLSPFELPEDTLLLGLDWNLGFGDGRYLNFLYGTDPDAGIGGTTVKAYLTWNITDWAALVGTVAYTGVLNESSRDALDEQGSDAGWCGDRYHRDFFWWGVSLKFAF